MAKNSGGTRVNNPTRPGLRQNTIAFIEKWNNNSTKELQYKYIQDKQNFGKWDKKMEELIDRHNNKPTKEHNAFMDIEQRYRLSK